jgi:thioredoxin reductase
VTARGFDPKAQAGKAQKPARHVQVLVIGGGPAGVAAALDAARNGAEVLLIDENPVGSGLMGLDVPLYYGGRYTGAVQAKARMIEQVFAASPGLAEAMDAGVEVELGVYCWGAWVPGDGLASLPAPVAGLADEATSWLVGFDRLIVATGARDVVLGFGGWTQPGVMGARALASLLTVYDAFSGRRLVVLGSGDLAADTVRLARERGLEVVAVIEARPEAAGFPDGVEVLVGHAPVLASGGVDGVERLTVRDLVSGAERTLICDTIVQAVGVTPTVELLDVLGAALEMRPGLGGFAPVSRDGLATSLPQVTLAGDVAGVEQGEGAYAYRQDWTRALAATGGDDLIVCQCEAVTRAALLAVRQPTYLGSPGAAAARRDLGRLLEDGPANQDQIKRLTRAGMGPCQGRRCREQIALTLAGAANVAAETIPLAGYRAPVRPLPLSVLAAWDEDPVVAAHWDVWFGIRGQWTPYADIGTEREALYDGLFGGDMHL